MKIQNGVFEEVRKNPETILTQGTHIQKCQLFSDFGPESGPDFRRFRAGLLQISGQMSGQIFADFGPDFCRFRARCRARFSLISDQVAGNPADPSWGGRFRARFRAFPKPCSTNEQGRPENKNLKSSLYVFSRTATLSGCRNF